MPGKWDTTVQVTADALGEMLVTMANGEAEYSNEDIAAAVLKTGLTTLLDDGPGAERTEAAAGVLYARLHDAEDRAWAALPQIEKVFWMDLATAALQASDKALLRQIEHIAAPSA